MDKREKKGQRSALGRGLAALISSAPVSVNPAPTKPDNDEVPLSMSHAQVGNLATKPVADAASPTPGQVRFVRVGDLFPNPKQPRQEFNQQEINELADSIKVMGLLQPVLVRPAQSFGPGKYEIVAGERRWRAASAVNLQQVPVIIKELTDQEVLEIGLVENIQRSNLSPLEEARAYQRLADDFNLSQREIAERVGKDRASVANYMRLLSLPEQILEMLKNGQITMGHAKAILTVKEPGAQLGLAKKVISESLSVRALEAIVSRSVVLPGARRVGAKEDARSEDQSSMRSDFPEVTDRLRTALGTKVVIRHHESGRGRIEVEYFSEQELDRLVEIITR